MRDRNPELVDIVSKELPGYPLPLRASHTSLHACCMRLGCTVLIAVACAFHLSHSLFTLLGVGTSFEAEHFADALVDVAAAAGDAALGGADLEVVLTLADALVAAGGGGEHGKLKAYMYGAPSLAF